MEYVLFAIVDAASVTAIVVRNGLPTAVVGVPVIAPVLELMSNPGASAVADHI
jgi:hypothetical protein